MAPFSALTRKVKAKKLAGRRVKKYKLKTKKAVQKRFHVIGPLSERGFKYRAIGHRHLLRNKSTRNLKAGKRKHVIESKANVRRLKKLLPYFKKKRSLRC